MGFKLQNWFRRRRRSRGEKNSTEMVLTVTEDTPADMLAGSMELLVQFPREHHTHTQRVTVERSTAMMDLLVQIATSHKLAASSYTLQAIGERGLVLPHQPNTPIGALDALQVKLLPKQGTFIPHKMKQANQPFETTFRLQVHLPRNQLYVSRVSPKMNLGEILNEVCREKNLDTNKYELRHPGNHEEKLDLSLSLENYHLQEVTLYAKQGQKLGSALSSQDIMALQRQEERRRHQAKQGVFSFMFRNKSKENSLSTDSLGERSISPARSDETGRSVSPLAPPTRPLRKRRQAPPPPIQQQQQQTKIIQDNNNILKEDSKLVINHSRNSSDSSGYHEASVLSDHPDSAGRMPETLPRRSRAPGKSDIHKLGQTSLSSKSMSNLAITTGGLSHSTSTTSISSTGIRKKRAAPLPPPSINRPLSSAISTQALERIVDSEESLTSDMEISKPSSDIAVSCETKNNYKIPLISNSITIDKLDTHCRNYFDDRKDIVVDEINKSSSHHADRVIIDNSYQDACHVNVDTACFEKKENQPVPKPRNVAPPKVPKRKSIPAMSSSSTIITTTTTDILPVNSSVIESDISINDKQDKQDTNVSIKSIENTVENDNEKYKNVNKHSDIFNTLDLSNEFDEKVVNLKNNYDNNIIIIDDNKENIISSEINTIDFSENSSNITNMELIKNKSTLDKITKNDIKNNNNDDSMCELNLKLPGEIKNTKIDDEQLNGENSLNPLYEKSNTPINVDNNLSFVMHGSCVELGMELTPFTLDNVAVCDELGSQDVVKAENEEQQTKTDILLQKVSTTLAAVIPSSNDVDEIVISSSKKNKQNDNILDREKINETANSTLNSQQDTSDYVSAIGEDLSGTDWEYQLPDPPSAFRDNSTPDSYGYETITLASVEAFKDPIIIIDQQTEIIEKTNNKLISNITKPTNKKIDQTRVVESLKPEIKPILLSQNSQENDKTNNLLKKNIIMELETKIENGCLNKKNNDDSKCKLNDDKISKITPVDNTLSNFTITTYSRQKSMSNIYNSNEDILKSAGQSDDKFVKKISTLSRNKSTTLPTKNYNNHLNNNSNNNNNEITRTQSVKTTQFDQVDFKKPINKNIDQDNKTNIYRSKSYIVLSNNSKYREDKIKSISDNIDNEVIMRATSFTNLNQDNSTSYYNSHQEKKETTNQRQNEVSKELQSVQILKSILPQLKNNQQTEDKIFKESQNSNKIIDARVAEEIVDEKEVKVNQQAEQKNKLEVEEPRKRYRYTGPPAINLGSWSERPSVNVQIKHDTDYKFGPKKITSNTSIPAGAKTIVNLNSSSNDVEIINYKDNLTKIQPKNNSNDKSTINGGDSINKNIYTSNNLLNGIVKLRSIADKNNDKPIITDVSIKKKQINQDDDVKIDTRPVNFKELTQTFGQINLRNKPNYNNSQKQQNRHSDYFDNREKFDSIIKSNDLNKLPVKRYTSVVGINLQNSNVGFLKNNNNGDTTTRINNPSLTKINSSTVGNKFNSESIGESCVDGLTTIKLNNSAVLAPPPPPPPPPTMPIITGVTLKNNNARPKSIPMCQDPRDQLLDSIRNFGRKKLKSVSTLA